MMGITPETETERLIVADPEWVAGLDYGQPRPGHPEGAVRFHIPHVLAIVDEVAVDAADRGRLRLAALVHDNFKYAVDRTRPRTGPNHHGALAARFVGRYVDDAVLQLVVELHDEAFGCWKKGAGSGKWERAEERALALLARLGPSVPFYLRFFAADNGTPGKRPDGFVWFRTLCEENGACPSFDEPSA